MSARLAVIVSLLGVTGCAMIGGGSGNWLTGGRDRATVAGRAVQLRWRQQITPDYQGAYIPVERAGAALDPARDRLYVGSSSGQLWAMSAVGSRVYSYDAGGAILAAPALDSQRDEVYVATEDGVLHMLTASSGVLRWRAELGAAVSQAPMLIADAVYVVTDNDIVIALSRETGDPLWRVRRNAPEGFHISHHAGLTLAGDRLLAAFTGGSVIALDPRDGSLLWERDTSTDLEQGDGTPRFVDVDTTPVVMGDTVYVASFAGGLYALDLRSGTVRYRDEELTGIIGIAPAGDRLLVLSSADHGIICLDRVDRTVVWRKTIPRGAPTEPVIAQDLVLVGESQGGFLTLALQSGQELGRIETGHGFTAQASVADGRGFILSNGGVLYAFALPGAR